MNIGMRVPRNVFLLLEVSIPYCRDMATMEPSDWAQLNLEEQMVFLKNLEEGKAGAEYSEAVLVGLPRCCSSNQLHHKQCL